MQHQSLLLWLLLLPLPWQTLVCCCAASSAEQLVCGRVG